MSCCAALSYKLVTLARRRADELYFRDEDLDDDFIPRGASNPHMASGMKTPAQPQKNTGNETGGGRKGDQGKSEAVNGVEKGTLSGKSTLR